MYLQTYEDKNVKLTLSWSGGTITNDQIKSESLNISEVLCSNGLTFGDCNAVKLELDVVGVNDIGSKRIDLKIQIYNKNGLVDETYEYNDFTVDSAKKTSGTEYRKLIAYDKMYYYSGMDVTDWYNAQFTEVTDSKYKGPWVIGTAYAKDEVVDITYQDNKESYRALSNIAGTSQPPYMDTRWLKLTNYNPISYASTTVKKLKNALLNKLGLVRKMEQELPNDNVEVRKKEKEGLTATELLRSICEINGCWGKVEGNTFVEIGRDYKDEFQGLWNKEQLYSTGSVVSQLTSQGITQYYKAIRNTLGSNPIEGIDWKIIADYDIYAEPIDITSIYRPSGSTYEEYVVKAYEALEILQGNVIIGRDTTLTYKGRWHYTTGPYLPGDIVVHGDIYYECIAEPRVIYYPPGLSFTDEFWKALSGYTPPADYNTYVIKDNILTDSQNAKTIASNMLGALKLYKFYTPVAINLTGQFQRLLGRSISFNTGTETIVTQVLQYNIKGIQAPIASIKASDSGTNISQGSSSSSSGGGSAGTIGIVVDNKLSLTSENPVQNHVVTKAMGQKLDTSQYEQEEAISIEELNLILT